MSSQSFAFRYGCTPPRIIGIMLICLLWIGCVAAIICIIHFELIYSWNIWLMFGVLAAISIVSTSYLVIKICEKRTTQQKYQQVNEIYISEAN